MFFTDLEPKRKRLLAVQSMITFEAVRLVSELSKETSVSHEYLLEILGDKAKLNIKSLSDEEVDKWIQHIDLKAKLVDIEDLKSWKDKPEEN